MEGFNKDDIERTDKDEIFSKVVRAGKRTYFFDVKRTRRNENYLTITESKKRFLNNGDFHFEKHKIFLYKEDFEKFSQGLEEVVAYIKDNCPVAERTPEDNTSDGDTPKQFSDVNFEEL